MVQNIDNCTIVVVLSKLLVTYFNDVCSIKFQIRMCIKYICIKSVKFNQIKRKTFYILMITRIFLIPGIILYTFIQFHSTPAIVTSVFIGVGIIFCGCAMVHNVFVWQKEKTNLVKAFRTENASNGVVANGHLNNTGNLSFHSMTQYNHPITLLQQGGPYVIRLVDFLY